jgi:endonuclease YncB( thermonuclease family)
MPSNPRQHRRRVLGLGSLAGLAALVHCAVARASCNLEPGTRHTVVEIVDGETLKLDNASEVRLIGAMAPPPLVRSDSPSTPADSRSELARLALGRTIELRFGGRRSDRHGRLLAHIIVEAGDGPPLWLQGHLVESGLARVYSFADNRECVLALLEREELARRDGRGLWQRPELAVRRATETAALLRARHTFQVVAGRVGAITSTPGLTQLDLGPRRQQAARPQDGLCILIGRPARRLIESEGKLLAGLEGADVRVRGWIETRGPWRGRPCIEVTHPEQIEVLPEREQRSRRRPAYRLPRVD